MNMKSDESSVLKVVSGDIAASGPEIYDAHKKWPFLWPPIYSLHLVKRKLDLLFKYYRIRKHITDFKTSTCSFCVDAINLQSPIASDSYLYETNIG